MKKRNIIRYCETDRLRKLYGSLVKKQNPELYKVITKASKLSKKDLETHFAKDKWDLDYMFYKEDVLTQVLGSDAMQYITFTLLNSDNYELQCSKKGMMLVSTKAKRKSRKAKK